MEGKGIFNREERKNLLTTASKYRIRNMPMNESGVCCRVCNDVPNFRNATVRLTMPNLLSVCPSAINNLFRNVWGFFENLT